ncbi:MAG: homoserine dehydrogenase [Candidatus Binataceae bacterium]|nr:homoserine dehydrogenase [Candidatus Binataceae bacterium]
MRLALLGCGTVGGGVVRLLRDNGDRMAQKLGAPIELAGIADRSLKPDRKLGITAALITRDASALVERPDVDLVIELFGGYEPARSLILRALRAGKDVVTANKALLAGHGAEIFRAAAAADRAIGFEASVAGGIPVIRTLRDALAGDRHRSVHGIVNGTCNSILTTMSERGSEFSAALAEAQRLGLAEADPTLDIEGHDSAHKLCLLAMLAFGAMLKPDQVHTEGIAQVTQADIMHARDLGYVIKLLAIAKDDDGTIEARVHPTMIPVSNLLASVRGAYNAINVHSEALGSTIYFGAGAGQMPTATAVIADVLDLARRRMGGPAARGFPLGFPLSELKRARIKPMNDVVCEYYLRFAARDQPGVLGAIASVLGRNGISIVSVIQQGRGAESTVPVIMRTHQARERNLRLALRQIQQRRIVEAAPAFIRIEDRL